MAKKTRITKVYTRSGDAGDTMLVGGEIVSKDSTRVMSYGDVDELNSILGLVLTGSVSTDSRKAILRIQNDLFVLGADLASKKNVLAPRIKKNRVTWIENRIDKYAADVGVLKEFVLPSGSFVGASLHLARTVCRRVERKMVSLAKTEWVNPTSLTYVNRLSDLLFVLARYENKVSGQGETFVDFKK
ncbi:MAG: ATP:cob(I)alamin adenosyltransferase [Spirochaetales bacterium]|nr:ATP:cob(I)alamin adenosyltransferase [Spirochaetales bacterium]|tara:strand:+ start:13397 stop:13957 length:561 start_codon:yes stop_codon:yes gene_type:complete